MFLRFDTEFIQKDSLQNEYQQNEIFAIQIIQFPALAFAPPCDVLNLFAIVAQNLPMSMAEGCPLFRAHLRWTCSPWWIFTTTFFLIEKWSSHFEVLAGYPITTNSLGGWHHSFNATVGCCHTTIWKFIQALKLEQGIVEFKQIKFQA